jgi:hypothetical protein
VIPDDRPRVPANRIITPVGHFAGLSNEEYANDEKTMTKDWRRG